MSLFNRILNNRSKTITFAAFVLAASTLGSKILGLFRDRVLAGTFGAGDELDVYYAAFRIPDFLYTVLIIGAVSSVFIPVFSEYRQKNREEAWKMASNAFTITMVVLALASAAFILLAPLLVPLIAPGFKDEKLSLAILVTRFMFVSPILFGISSILGSLLQVFRRFLVYSLAPIFYNIGIIIGAIWFTDLFERFGVERVFGLVAGVVLGALLHAGIQVPSVVNAGFRYEVIWNLRDRALQKMARLFLPRTIGLLVHQINLVVITALASTLKPGSIAVFNFANNLQYLPIGIFGISFATAVFPLLSEKIARNEKGKFKINFITAFRNILFFVVPLSVFFFLLRAQIVRVVLGTGEFGWEDTRLTAAALGIFALSIIAQSLVPLLARAFYAFQNTRTPVLISIAAVLLNIALSFLFVWLLSFPNYFEGMTRSILDLNGLSDIAILGLVIAFSLSSLMHFLLLLVFLSFVVGPHSFRSIVASFWKISLASGWAGLAIFVALRLFALAFRLDTFMWISFQLMGAFVGGAGIYLAILTIFRSQELTNILGAIRKEFSPRSFSRRIH